MQISSISLGAPCQKVAFRASKPNFQRIQELEQKEIKIRSASEGFNASLPIEEEIELELRKEYQFLVNKHAMLQGLSEGCNCGLEDEEFARMIELKNILSKMDNEKTTIANNKQNINSDDQEKRYGVPYSTFYGDWAN